MTRKYTSTLKNEVFYINFVSVMLISILFIVFLTVAMYKMNLEIAYQRLEKDNTFMATHTEGVFDTLSMSSEVLLEFMKLYDYEQADNVVKSSIINLSTATKEANTNIIACYIGLESNGKLFNNFEVPSNYDARTRPWYKESLKSPDKVTVSPPYKDVTTNEWVISLSKPIIDDEGILIGVAAVDFTLEFASKLMLEKGFYETQSNYMLSEDGTVFIHPNLLYSNRNADEIVSGLRDLFISDSGFVEYDLDDKGRIAYYTKLELSNWVLVSAIDSSEVIVPVVQRVVFMVLGLLALATALSLIQVKIFDQRFVKPISALRDRITAITTGQRLTKEESLFSNKELAEIARTIEGMAESSLREKAEELELILRSTSDGILLLNLEGRVIHANDRFMDMWSLDKAAHFADFSNSLLVEQLIKPQDLQYKNRSHILLPNTNLEESCILAEKIRVYFEKNALIFNGKNIPFTLSLGVASYDSGILTFNKLIELADKSCYEAKALGRNRVVASGASDEHESL